MMHIACSADELYARHTGAMLHSLFTSNDARNINVHFIRGPNVPEYVCDRLRILATRFGARLNILDVPEQIRHELESLGNIPGAQWYRVLLPQLLPDLDRIIYLDSDLLVLRDLQPLWNIELGDAPLAAITNPFPTEYSDYPVRVLGMDSVSEYFNTGVMVLNLREMRVKDILSAVKAHAAKRKGDLFWPEQDSLNVVLRKARIPLSPEWNMLYSIYIDNRCFNVFDRDVVERARRRPAVIHFEGLGMAKPWHYLCEHPYKAAYYEHLRQTPWPVPPPEGRTCKNFFLKNKLRLRRFARMLLGRG